MNAIRKLWQSMANLGAALDRLAGLAHQAADTIEERIDPPALGHAGAMPALENGSAEPARAGGRGRKQER